MFCPLTIITWYYSSLLSITKRFLDPAMKAAIELQIKEFGQTPKQLFREPHPKRRTHSDPKPSEPTERELTRELSSTASTGSFSEDWVFVQTDEGMGMEMLKYGNGNVEVWEWKCWSMGMEI